MDTKTAYLQIISGVLDRFDNMEFAPFIIMALNNKGEIVTVPLPNYEGRILPPDVVENLVLNAFQKQGVEIAPVEIKIKRTFGSTEN